MSIPAYDYILDVLCVTAKEAQTLDEDTPATYQSGDVYRTMKKLVLEEDSEGLSVVQRTQIREALKSFGSECSQAAIAWARTPEFSEPIESREKRIDAVLSAIGLILGDTDET